MCCTFNMEKAENIFYENRYRTMVNYMQQRDKNTSFDANKEFQDLNDNIYPEPGKEKGLKVIIDAHSDMVSGGTVSDDFDGFYAIVSGRNQFPMTDQNSILIRPGYENLVTLSAKQVTSSEYISHVPIKKRNCLFPDEVEMEYHKNYTQNNCVLECKLRYALGKVIKSFNRQYESLNSPIHGRPKQGGRFEQQHCNSGFAA